MEKAENVIKYYVFCNKLKNTIRTGWMNWHVEKERLESVAEHIYSAQMLAIAMKKEYEYNIDLYKVLYMLAVHEIEEIIIGDLTLFDISKEEKREIGKLAVSKVLNNLNDKEEIIDLINEFEEKETEEAKFAFYCDKLECDLQSKMYDEENCIDLESDKVKKASLNFKVDNIIKEEQSWSKMWLRFGQERYNYDDNFLEVSNYAKNNNIKILIKD